MGASKETAYSDIAVREAPDREVRFTSGKTICVEALREGRWQGRYWSADGRINTPDEFLAADAFSLRLDKQHLSTGWSFVSAAEAPRTERGARHFVVELSNATHPTRVKIHTLLDGTPVLTRWLEIANESDSSAALTAVSPWSGRLWPGQNFTLGCFTKDTWASEGWFEWRPLPIGITTVSCDKGQGHNDPFFVVRNEVTGEYFIGHLAWSANWEINFTRNAEGVSWSIGPTAVNAQRVIAPGEMVRTPAVHLGHVSGSLDSAVQAMHEHLRRSVLPPRPSGRDCLIQYLVPADQGYYKPFDEASAIECADVAAAIGAEVFILDAYWWDVTLDWIPSAKRFPRGLEPLIEHVRKKGMLFGLYVEAEGGRGDYRKSKIGQQHPEWFGPHDVLNLTIPEAASWMESEIIRLVETYRLDLYRLDYNPGFTYDGPATLRDGIVENNYWRYYEVFYDLYERLRKKYPNLILQQAAAGGARNDLGTAGRFHETYLTDGLSIPRELQVYSGLTLGLPPEIFVILHGADGGVGLGKPQNLDTVLRVTFSLSTPQIFVGMVAPTVGQLSPERRERFGHYASIYKQFVRPLLPSCRMYHHQPVNSRGGVESSPWFAVEYSSPDRKRGWATIVRMRNGPGGIFVPKYGNDVINDKDASSFPERQDDTYILKPRGLDPASTYRVTFDSINTTVEADGLCLLREGLPVRLENAGMSELLLFEAT
jgi:alpha-galactosidase